MTEFEVPIQEGVEITLDKGMIKTSGSKGELRRSFSDPHIKISSKDGKVVLVSDSERKATKAMMGTFRANLKNMMTGVSKGWESRMKLVYAHFPVKTEVKDGEFIVKNFLGGRAEKKAKIMEGTEVEVNGEEIIIRGADKEKVGQTAANIEKSVAVKNHDRRVFQDGIYITQKPQATKEDV